MAEDGVELSSGELVGVESEFLRFVRTSEPLHVVFDEKLDDIAADLDAAFEGFVRSASGRHVSAEFHFLSLSCVETSEVAAGEGVFGVDA